MDGLFDPPPGPIAAPGGGAVTGGALTSTIAHQITWIQAYSFMLFALIYTPCLSTIATIITEGKSRSFSLLALAWPLGLAWVVSFVFYQAAHLLLV